MGGSGDTGGPGFARGGVVRGAGTSTSDSIRAWLSHGEFVQPTRAVRHYGTDFMESIRRLQFPRFNMGGLVDGLGAIMPRDHFADGGLVTAGGGGRAVVINLGSGETFNATMTDDELGRLGKAAAKRVVRSAGRKPSWFKG